jgi:hypothetical protein
MIQVRLLKIKRRRVKVDPKLGGQWNVKEKHVFTSSHFPPTTYLNLQFFDHLLLHSKARKNKDDDRFGHPLRNQKKKIEKRKKEEKGGSLPLSLSVYHWVEAPSYLVSPLS